MNRVINSAKYLKNAVIDGKTFYVGFGVTELTNLGKNHPGLIDLINGHINSVIVTGKKGSLKDNIAGKFVRKQPESKESIWKNIHYYSNRFQKEIDYNREFQIWEKELLHKYNLALEAATTPQGETVLHFPAFKMIDSDNLFLKAGAAMNMAISLGSYFMIYDSRFEPIVPVTKFEHKRILSSGTSSIAEKLKEIETEIHTQGDTEKSKGNSYRFALLKEKGPSDVIMGLGGFDEYLMFEYVDYDLMILENLKTGNATFIFKLSIFDKEKEMNKQTAKNELSFLKRIVHHSLEDWDMQFNKFFKV